MGELQTNLRLACGRKFWAGVLEFLLLCVAAGFETMVAAFRSETLLEAGVFACYGLLQLVFLPMELPGVLPASEKLACLGKKAGLFFLSGALWAEVGLALSMMTNSRAMAYASSFIFCYGLIILQERYLPEIFMISPQEWIAPRAFWVGGMGGVALWVAEVGSKFLTNSIYWWAALYRVEMTPYLHFYIKIRCDNWKVDERCI